MILHTVWFILAIVMIWTSIYNCSQENLINFKKRSTQISMKSSFSLPVQAIENHDVKNIKFDLVSTRYRLMNYNFRKPLILIQCAVCWLKSHSSFESIGHQRKIFEKFAFFAKHNFRWLSLFYLNSFYCDVLQPSKNILFSYRMPWFSHVYCIPFYILILIAHDRFYFLLLLLYFL